MRVSSLLPDAISIPRGLNLRALAPQLRGLAEIQDLASQAVGLVCAPSPGAYWWDACCGSGGKALHLADLMRGEGRLLATDVRTGILDEMARRLRESRCGGVEARRWDGITPPDTMFDGVLVDAPCSGLGTWHRNPDARWRMTLDEVKRLAGVQLDLLRLCAGRVKPGGALVYATCTLTSLENQTVTDLFLAETPSFEPAPFVNPLNGSPCDGQVWVYPWEADCNGMFIARFVRRTGDGNR